MAVNAATWKKFPVSDRDQSFNADHAIKRLANLAAGSVETFNMGFLWRNSNGPPNNKNSYRLPVVDVINGRMTLIPHAVFTAAAILSGAHGGLEGVVGEEEKAQLRKVVTAIYKMLRDTYGDPRVIPPWERNDTPPSERPNRQLTASSINTAVATLPVADESRNWHGDAAKGRISRWADGDLRRYRQGFLWWDNNFPELRTSYQLPVADVVDGKLMLVPRGVNAVAAMVASAPGGINVPAAEMPEIQAIVSALQERLGKREDGGENPMAVPLRPPTEWFDKPNLNGPTRLTVTEDGRVFGHLAEWDTCHMGIQERCRMAPHSNSGYKYFMNGSVLTADGSERLVGKITMGTGHADLRLGYIPAADHYDNTGTTVAIVAAYEDEHGPVVAGAAVPEATPQQLAVLRRSPLSGDWRPTSSGLELVAALAVNSPGFPIMGFTASGDQTLVAAGMILSDEELSTLKPLADELLTGPDQELLSRLDAYNERAAKLTKSAHSRRLDSILAKMGGVPDGM